MRKILEEVLYEKQQCTILADEIDVTCDDLRMKGLDLSKIKIVEEPKYTKYEREWMEEFGKITKQLRASGKDLSNILIAESGNGMNK